MSEGTPTIAPTSHPTGRTYHPHGLKKVWEGVDELSRFSRLGLLVHLTTQAWRSVKASPLTSIVTFLTMVGALALLSGFILLIENLEGTLSSTHSELYLSIYLREGAAEPAISEMKDELKAIPEVDTVTFLSKAEALELFRKSLGPEALLLEGLDANNPLPPSLEVKFHRKQGSKEVFERVATQFSERESVELIQYNRGLLGQLGRLLHYFRVAGILALLTMLVITGFIIANTIKLALYVHRDEIEIMRLVGATDRFVRAPYVIEGCVQGLFGALVSIGLAYVVYRLLSWFFLNDKLLGPFVPELRFLSSPSITLIVLVGIAVGAGASYLSVKRFISS